MRFLAVIASFCVGLPIGSFLTVVVHRVPEGLSIVHPRSRCPSCEAEIKPADNIPVVSYVLRRGRCRNCEAPISPRYPLLEAGTAVLFVAVALRAHTLASIPALCVFVAGLLALSAIDLERLRLPSPIIYVTAAIGVPLLVASSAIDREWPAIGRGALCACVSFAAFGAVWLARPDAIGFGDVRLAPLCAFPLGWIGYRVALVGLLVACVVGGVVGLTLIATHRATHSARLPFGPFLAAGTVVAILFGTDLATVWLR